MSNYLVLDPNGYLLQTERWDVGDPENTADRTYVLVSVLPEVTDFPPQPHQESKLLVSVVEGEPVYTWVDARSLEEARASKVKEITAARVAADFSTFPFMGEDIQCDQGGRSQIDGVSSYIGLFGSLPPGFPGAWKTLANNYLPIPDVSTFKAMVQAMVAQGTANFVKSEMLKAYVNDPSRTIAEIDAVTW